MIVYPTMELQNGRCVSLDQGRLDQPTIWHVDPVETARGWAAAGATWMHLTDFDAVDGGDGNAALVEEIIRSVGIPVQLAGGMRSRESVERWIDKGAGRVVVGTLAAREPDLVRELAKYHPDQVVLAVDVWQGQVMTDGWRQASALTPETFVTAFAEAPLAGVVITDIDNDMEDLDAQLGLISSLADLCRAPVIASGVVRAIDDIARLKYLRSISGALVGKALFRKTVDLAEALDVARPEPEPIAEFR